VGTVSVHKTTLREASYGGFYPDTLTRCLVVAGELPPILLKQLLGERIKFEIVATKSGFFAFPSSKLVFLKGK
jgi:hypothetical protein